MRVQHNIPAMNAYRNYNNNSKSINRNLEKLSSGYRINRAGDDAAGLAISEKMRAQITGLEVAQKNAKDGISLVQTAEAALTEVHDMLNRMYSLAEQSSNGTYAEGSNGIDRDQLQKEVSKLRDEIDRIASTANFNGTKLLDGSLGSGTPTAATATLANDNATGVTLKSSSDLDPGLTGDITITAGSQYVIVDEPPTGFSYDTTVAKTGNGQAAVNQGKLYAESAAGEVTVTLKDSDGNAAGTLVFDVSGAQTDNSTTKLTFASSNGIEAKSGDTVNTAMGSVTTTTFSGTGGLTLWIGAEAEADNALAVSIDSIKTDALVIDKIDISTQAGALNALVNVQKAIDYVSDIRGELGATQNRLEHTINNLSAMQENMQDAESSIRDTDVAEEMMKYTKNSILVQSAQAMLAQANQLPQGVLQLLQ